LLINLLEFKKRTYIVKVRFIASTHKPIVWKKREMLHEITDCSELIKVQYL